MRRGVVTHRYHVMIRTPAITTAIRIPVPVARNMSAMFIAIFLSDVEFDWESKNPANCSPGIDLGLSPFSETYSIYPRKYLG